MKIHLVFPVLPPALDGIGDHTACLARALRAYAQVKVLTGQDGFDGIEGVEVEPAFTLSPLRDVEGVASQVRRDTPDWLVVQYNPFSYGRWGFNPHLPRTIRHIKRSHPGVRVALMVHEPFVPVTDLKAALMTTWQRWQLYALMRAADLSLFSIEPWARQFSRAFPARPVRHLPVGSNIPRERITRREARRLVGIDPDALVVGVFGSAHPSRLLPFIHAAARALDASFDPFHVLYVGPHGRRVQEALASVPLIDAGPLPPAAVSQHFAAMDLYLAPFRKGVSARRGSFIAGIQHGIATVSTRGVHTDAMLLEQAGSAFMLAPDDAIDVFEQQVLQLAHDPERRLHLAEAGQQFYERYFSWERIAHGLVEAMAACGDPHPALPQPTPLVPSEE